MEEGVYNVYNVYKVIFGPTLASLSKFANNSFNIMISSSAVTVDAYSVKPTISANNMLNCTIKSTAWFTGITFLVVCAEALRMHINLPAPIVTLDVNLFESNIFAKYSSIMLHVFDDFLSQSGR